MFPQSTAEEPSLPNFSLSCACEKVLLPSLDISVTLLCIMLKLWIFVADFHLGRV